MWAPYTLLWRDFILFLIEKEKWIRKIVNIKVTKSYHPSTGKDDEEYDLFIKSHTSPNIIYLKTKIS